LVAAVRVERRDALLLCRAQRLQRIGVVRESLLQRVGLGRERARLLFHLREFARDVLRRDLLELRADPREPLGLLAVFALEVVEVRALDLGLARGFAGLARERLPALLPVVHRGLGLRERLARFGLRRAQPLEPRRDLRERALEFGDALAVARDVA